MTELQAFLQHYKMIQVRERFSEMKNVNKMKVEKEKTF
jgi:hypothetical protein